MATHNGEEPGHLSCDPANETREWVGEETQVEKFYGVTSEPRAILDFLFTISQCPLCGGFRNSRRTLRHSRDRPISGHFMTHNQCLLYP
jgi:hypothetical protein